VRPPTQDFVAILDFGSQYSQLIARTVREAKVYSEIFPFSISPQELSELNPKGIILSGGPSSVYEPDAPHPSPGIYRLKIPVLGICYGMQVMAYQLGGKVRKLPKGEYGKAEIHQTMSSPLFGDLNPDLIAWMSHGDIVEKVPEGFKILATTEMIPVASMGNFEKKLYGVQFHPEVSHTPWGIELIKNFLYPICTCQPTWTMGSFIQSAVKEARERVKKEKVICAISGGVDSVTTAVLVHKAIGRQLTGIFVDHGLLRKGEAEQVRQVFQKHFKISLLFVDASERFLRRFKNVVDPERKRKIVGEEFVRVFEEKAREIPGVTFLAQGTLYPDVIESQAGSRGPADRIKSHHNVAGLPERMNLKLLEPLRYLFKDEVREVARELGIPREIWGRQPFPGPGLAIRIIGEVTRERLEILREADKIIQEEIHKAGLSDKIWQFFAVLPVIKSVGVMGDKRTYAYPVVLRAVTSRDGMTADWPRIPYKTLERISSRVLNEVQGVNRFLFDISTKPPATIEWE